MSRRFPLAPVLLGVAWLLSLALASSDAAEWHLRWSQPLPARKPAWEHTQRMGMDTGYSPVVAGPLVVVGCEHSGALLAYDARTGREQWRYYTAGPIRVAPVADDKHIFAGSDDGVLYCLDHAGKLVWKLRGGPSERMLIGHERLISAWPISARPVVEGGVLYFVAGYWPVDGIHVHAVEAATGRPLWKNDTAVLRPARAMAILDGKLLIDGDNSSAVLDAKTGELLKEKPTKLPPAERPLVAGLKGNITSWSQSGEVLAVGTTEGVFGFSTQPGPAGAPETAGAPPAAAIDTSPAERVLAETGVAEGYCLVAGLKDGALVEGLLRKSKLHVVALDADEQKVEAIRRRLDGRGLFADHRLALFAGEPGKFKLPPYFASLIASESDDALAAAAAARGSLRPYGGVLASRGEGNAWKFTRRDGPPAGAADWSHEFRDAANSLASPDLLVKAPLGLLWYGGPAAHARFYFDGNVDHQSGHGLNPQPVPAQIVGGRMILQGPGLLAAIDIYTGRVLWETPLPKVYTFGGAGGGLGIHSKKHPRPWEYEEALAFEVQPTERSRPSGFNCVTLDDGIYLAAAKHLLRFDPATGKELSRWPVPIEGDLRWGGLRAAGDTLVATLFRPKDLRDAEAGHDGNGGDWAGDRMPMSHLAAIQRQTGKLLWSREAKWGFLNRSGICLGDSKVFCVDLVTEGVLEKQRAAGRAFPASPPTLHALDLATGREAWSFPLDVYVQNIVYSEPHKLLLAPCRYLREWQAGKWVDLSKDVRRGMINKKSIGKMRAFRVDGTIAWEMAEAAYHSPHIALGDLMIDRDGVSYDLKTGKRHLRTSPTTGQPEEWSFKKGGCNHLIACPNLVTWRCAYYDLTTHAGVTSLTGMDAGCSPTLIPAGGILNIPNFGTHHKRNRMTAMALVPLEGQP